MIDYKPFPISNFRTGFNQALEPWLLPRDGFPYLKNAHLYRGVVEKIIGYNLFASFSYTKIVRFTGIDGVNQLFTGTLSPLPSTNNFYAQAIIVAYSQIEFFTYASDGVYPIVNLASNLGGTGTVNLSTGAVILNFNTAPGLISGNAVIFRYDFYSTAAAGSTDIMGIKQYYAQNGGQEIVVFNTRRAGKIIGLTGFAALDAGADYGVTEIPHQVQAQNVAPTPAFDGVTLIFTGTLSAPVVPGSVKIKVYHIGPPIALFTTITDNGMGGLVDNETIPGSGFINYFTGAWSFTFNVAPLATDTMNTFVCNFGDTFSGDYTNFFTTCNLADNVGSYMFLTNNINLIRYYDGMCLLFLNTNLSSDNPNNLNYPITRCLHVAINRSRLLLVAPYLNNVPQLSLIVWSAVGFPLDFTNNEFLQAPTAEAIRLFSFINSDMVVRFAKSERIFTYTNDAFNPFRWDTTNSLWRCDTQYSDINYDSWYSSVSRDAIVGSDGVNAQRSDSNIPDFTLNDRGQYEGPIISINQKSIGQCYGERFDDLKEGWLCFKRSTPRENPSTVERSDSILAFNYLDNTYAVYDFPLNCLGYGQNTTVDTWGDNFDQWGSANYTWGSFSQQTDSPVNLGGDRFGNIYQLGTFNTFVDENNVTKPILFDVLSKNFNPFVEEGQLARLGYVDFFFSADQTTKVRIQFFVDDNLFVEPDGSLGGWYQESTLVFDPSDSLSKNAQAKIWKRVYSGAVGKEHTVRIYQNADDFTSDTLDQPVRMHAMIPYMKPAGRIFG